MCREEERQKEGNGTCIYVPEVSPEKGRETKLLPRKKAMEKKALRISPRHRASIKKGVVKSGDVHQGSFLFLGGVKRKKGRKAVSGERRGNMTGGLRRQTLTTERDLEWESKRRKSEFEAIGEIPRAQEVNSWEKKDTMRREGAPRKGITTVREES